MASYQIYDVEVVPLLVGRVSSEALRGVGKEAGTGERTHSPTRQMMTRR